MPFMARYDPFSPTFDHPLLNSSPDYGSRNGTFRNRPIGDFGSQMTFRERNKRLREYDDEKNQLIEELLIHLEATESQLKQLQLDHTRESQYNRDGQHRENTLQDQLRRVKEAMDRNAFIIALIDGDGMIFTKDFLSKGEAGGKEAAVAFSNSMIGYASENLGHLESPKLIARIYANFTTLSETLVKTRLIDKASTFHEFVRGFNSSKLLFDFVDAGSKKHAAQQKISELMRLQLYDCHCHQVLLGCSQNNDHAHMLEDYRNDQELGDHISILESGPVHKDLADLDSNFKRTRFDGVFSTIQMVKAPVSAPLPKAPPALAAALPALTKVESNKTNSSASPANTPQMNWATVTAQAHATPTPTAKVNGTRVTTPSSSISSEPTKVKPYGKSIDTNRHGMRIDRVDTSIPNYEIQRVKKLKLCNIYYLQGVTLCTSGNCSHRHDYPISNYERKILREVARMTPCYYKTDCDDHECIYGHRCPQSKADSQGCYYGEDCRFFGWGHGIDTRVCKTVKV